MTDIFGKQLKFVIQSIVCIQRGKMCMLKVRLQGTLNDIRWFKGLLERNEQVKVQEVSEPFTNKGTNKYFRVYAEIDKKEE